MQKFLVMQEYPVDYVSWIGIHQSLDDPAVKDATFFALNLKSANRNKILAVFESTSANLFVKKVWVHSFEEYRFGTSMNIYPQQWLFRRTGNSDFEIAFTHYSADYEIKVSFVRSNNQEVVYAAK